ncbi:MOB kinase activator-like 2 isoform X3 [Toxorhynchites rutilus septentrionalis]|uniref:MOB kinase activator-like 2 isoform X3 n=1 Tax=Toxorhynchites rutilus septentrionalis TaxID=329112 RepID=UPI002479F6D9|nr:MOB kinase activator-like 2 isoform X3 [Toxorhynchites rutilus septentrionalis]XP_055621200.1 MOB kinase activator-like 2 isoform X3 [Toxorhynchites rutilus septentrionalis]XP_055621201.1 MOB kinase activator-like 2 isoform X3 [Toxorhynchites rutilus septentrionalis]XP_055621203.1 MOB kinase activator-like 2 isoform X3 [Toxorhynchites rutilus septentrionalis]XP_055621204.1 MOB kinase activator-like 2 isoform X3 [Toxorhynchites rutilus septentrionalis]
MGSGYNKTATLGLIECILILRKPMWQVGIVPAKLSDAIGSLVRYAQESLNFFFCPTKARRKERDGDSNQSDTKLYLEESVLERKLPDADLRLLVDLPAGLDYNEWLASHTLALFEHVNLVYGTISEFCTTSGCPDMTGPGTRMYLWFDEKGKKTRVAAPQYIDYVMTFTQKTVSDESIFPTKYANEFPSSFESIARKILRLLFHVIAHLYAAHFREVALLGLHAHLNLTFAHLTALHRRFNLIEPKETEVLRDLEIALRLTEDPVPSTGSNQQQQQQSSSGSDSASMSATSASTGSTGSTAGTMVAGGSCVENNNSSSSDSGVAMMMHSLIDGDATAQPICKQPLESGNVNNSHNATSSKEQMMQTCGPGGLGGGAGGSGSSTGSVGVIGCGVGYSTSSSNSTQQTSNTQTTA